MTPKFEIPSEMREMAEKSVDQARKAFEGFVGAARKAAGAAESAAGTMQANARDAGTKAVQFAEQSVAAAFDHAQKLIRAKDPQEFFQLQSEFVKAQLATAQAQAKDFGAAVQSQAKDFGAMVQKTAADAAAAVKK